MAKRWSSFWHLKPDPFWLALLHIAPKCGDLSGTSQEKYEKGGNFCKMNWSWSYWNGLVDLEIDSSWQIMKKWKGITAKSSLKKIWSTIALQGKIALRKETHQETHCLRRIGLIKAT
jgi:hypothetical protein